MALMNPDEAFTIVANERQQIGLLRVVHIKVAVSEEHDGVEGIEILRFPL